MLFVFEMFGFLVLTKYAILGYSTSHEMVHPALYASGFSELAWYLLPRKLRCQVRLHK